MDGVVVVDKPAGPTSHDVVERVRQLLRVRRAGHTGTLDPFATGVLPICLGKATRLARFLADSDKSYRASVRLGFATTTDDLTGEPLGPPAAVAASEDAVRRACLALTGALQQVPPAYSAKRVDGQRLYDLARRGVAVERAPVAVTVRALEVMAIAGDRVELDVRCSAGTYVRALARDLGAALGTGGHLAALCRTEAAGFGLDRAVRWEALADGVAALVPLAEVLSNLPAVTGGAEGARAVRHGRDLDRRLVLAGFPAGAPARVRVLDEGGHLLALAVPRDGAAPAVAAGAVLHPDLVLAD